MSTPRYSHQSLSEDLSSRWSPSSWDHEASRLLVLFEVVGTMVFIHPTHDLRHPDAYGRPISTPDGYVYIRRGSHQLLRLLKEASANNDVDLAIFTSLSTNSARRVMRALDESLSRYVHVYDSYFNKIEPMRTDDGSSLRDYVRMWGCRSGPASQHNRLSTVMLDCDVAKNREFPNNLIYIPEFSAESCLWSRGQSFTMHQVVSYVSRVLNDWVEDRESRGRDVRKILSAHLSKSAVRWNKLLLLVDMNGTFLLRARAKLPIQSAPFATTKNSSKTIYYYLRPDADRFVQWLKSKQESCDCIDVAFYTSMKEENALVPLRKLDRFGSLYLYSQEFNKHDSTGENSWDMMRDFHKLWTSRGGPAFGHSERSTIMIDDSMRKMREFSENLVLVPEFVPERLLETEAFKLEYVMQYVDVVINQWMATYTYDRDVREILSLHRGAYAW